MIKRDTTLAALLLIAAAAAAQAQSLSLADALRRADQHAYANRIGRAEADAAGAQSIAALRGILPTVRLEAGFARTNDPIGVFGTTLRQRAIAASDFDPDRLNHPGAVTNYAGGAVIEQPLFNLDAHLGRRAAGRGADAATAAAEWTGVGARLDVIRAYFGAVLAAEKAITLEAADRAARSHATQAQRLVDAGIATRSDALLALVRAGDVEVLLFEAQGAAALARAQLATVLGVPGDTVFTLPATLPPADRIRELLASDVTIRAERRADLTAARYGRDAAQADVRRALSLYVPRINAFGRYDWNSSDRLYAGPEAWSVGVMASWTPFAGAHELAERAATTARKRAADARLDAARAQADLELAAAENARGVALRRLEIAERAAAQSAEAHRIVTRKYEGGLATVAELLDAAAIETQSALGLSAARYQGIIADAERRRAAGSDLSDTPILLTPEIAGNIR
jgi:outer membrane protein TolC